MVYGHLVGYSFYRVTVTRKKSVSYKKALNWNHRRFVERKTLCANVYIKYAWVVCLSVACHMCR